MELQIARQIIDTLAQGIHPVTGEAMPDDSPYNAPPVIRALHVVSRVLADVPSESPAVRVRPAGPVNAGKPWASEDDAALEQAFDAGVEVKELAQRLGRTRFGVEQRLIKLGKVTPPAGGGRFGQAPASH